MFLISAIIFVQCLLTKSLSSARDKWRRCLRRTTPTYPPIMGRIGERLKKRFILLRYKLLKKQREHPAFVGASRSKRVRLPEVALTTYVPQWGVLSTDAICHEIPAMARKVGLDPYQGLILSIDRATYEKVGVVDACTEMLGLLPMVSSYTFFLFFLYDRFSYRLFLGRPPSLTK